MTTTTYCAGPSERLPRRTTAFGPGPPDEAVRLALRADVVDVLELGAGTGGLTRRLVRHHAHVRAVEPDERMRADPP